MLQYAHLTLSELPGTVAVWLAGIGLGTLLGAGGLRAFRTALRRRRGAR